MSHIFDMLERMETERRGVELAPLSAVTELLRIAEQVPTPKAERIASHEAVVEAEAEVESKPPVALTEPPPHVEEAESSTQDGGADHFYQFQSIRASVTSESRLVCLTEEASLAAEKFRFVGVRLRQIQHSRALKKVLVTSTIPQEGKSTVAANLGCILAIGTQHKTLLVDGDLRRPCLTQLFGLLNLPGMAEWLRGERDASGSIYHLEGPGCWILPAGNALGNPLELLQSPRLSAVTDQLVAAFDWIVIDSPPVLPVADTSIWMRLADGILLVTRQGTTEKEQLKRGLHLIESSKLIGTIVNGAANTAHTNYYYQYTRPATKYQSRSSEE